MKKQRKERLVQSEGGIGQSVVFCGTTVLWQGRNRLTVEGAEKIGFLSPERILVMLSHDKLTVCGRGLMCLSFHGKVLVIGGRIDSLWYGEEKV